MSSCAATESATGRTVAIDADSLYATEFYRQVGLRQDDWCEIGLSLVWILHCRWYKTVTCDKSCSQQFGQTALIEYAAKSSARWSGGWLQTHMSYPENSHLKADKFAPRTGEAWWWFGGLALIKVPSEQTEGRFSLIEMVWPPNLEVPLHVHTREDEVFHVIAGKISYRIGTSRFDASSGQSVFAPKNTPHGFTVTSDEPAHYLIVYSPAGFEGFIRESSQPALSLALPPDPHAPIEAAELQRIAGLMASKYGCRFVPSD